MTRKAKARQRRQRAPICFGLTFEKWVSPLFWNSYRKIERYPTDVEVQIVNARTDRARNEIVEKFLEHPHRCTHLLFLDSDQVFPPDTVKRLMAHNKLVVGCLYFHRAYPYQPHMYKWNHEILTRAGEPQMDPIEDWEPDELVECDALGTGGMMIAREVFEKVEYPWFEYGGMEESEDVTFCRKLGRVGIEIYCDTACESGHLTTVIIGHENWEWAKKEMRRRKDAEEKGV